MFSPQHPLWLVGFRPFFSLAILSGMVLPILWILGLHGTLNLPETRINPTQWHAHEMFYGFGWAVLGGFLLTSTKNWVNVRGHHGLSLMTLCLAWILERLCCWFADTLPLPLFWLGTNFFPLALVLMLLHTLLKYRQQDSYRVDNRFFLLALPLFLVAKNLLLSESGYAFGWQMTLALFRVAFLVMLERTLTQFMKGVFQVSILRSPKLDLPIKLLALLLVFPAYPAALESVLSLSLVVLLGIRLRHWHFGLAMSRLDVGIMHLGYLAIMAQLAYRAIDLIMPLNLVGTPGVHLFTFGAMGLVIPAMMVRIGNGHTGRKVVFDRRDRIVLWIMLAALALRVAMPQIVAGHYLRWLDMSAFCWLLAFGLMASRYLAYFFHPRIDGKIH